MKKQDLQRVLAALSASDRERVRKIAADLLASKVANGKVNTNDPEAMSREAAESIHDAMEALNAVDRFMAG